MLISMNVFLIDIEALTLTSTLPPYIYLYSQNSIHHYRIENATNTSTHNQA